MQKLTIEIEEKIAQEIKNGTKVIAVVDKQKLEDVDGGGNLIDDDNYGPYNDPTLFNKRRYNRENPTI